MTAREPFVPTTITIDPAVRQRLKTFGTHGMTYNDILMRIMDDIEKDRFLAELRREWLETKPEDWVSLDDLDEELRPKVPAASARRSARGAARGQARAAGRGSKAGRVRTSRT